MSSLKPSSFDPTDNTYCYYTLGSPIHRVAVAPAAHQALPIHLWMGLASVAGSPLDIPRCEICSENGCKK